MNREEVTKMIQYLQRLYPIAMHHVSGEMITAWHKALQNHPKSLMGKSVRRWIAQHLPSYAPTLQALMDMANIIVEDEEEALDSQRRQRSRSAVAHQTQTLTDDIGTIMTHAASGVGASWAQCHIMLFTTGLAHPRRAHDAAQQCRTWAREYPHDGADWLRQAEAYDTVAEEWQDPAIPIPTPHLQLMLPAPQITLHLVQPMEDSA